MLDWKDILKGNSFGFFVRLPRQFGSREILKAWDNDNHVLGFSMNEQTAGEHVSHCQSQSEYQSLVKKAIGYIESGECTKLVTSRIFKIEFGSNGEQDLMEKWLKTFPDAFVFVIHHPQHGLWMGASPELLLYRNGENVHSVALAGSKSKEDQSPWGDKEIEEHQVVLRMIEETFLRYDVNHIKCDETKELIFRNVKHLCTPLNGEFSGEFSDLVKGLYPTPALSGWPKAKAIDWLLANEPFERGLYGGVLNFSDGEEHWSMVILRCCHKTSNGWLGHVGGGVMHDSVPELEWQETEWKRQAFIFANDAHFQ